MIDRKLQAIENFREKDLCEEGPKPRCGAAGRGAALGAGVTAGDAGKMPYAIAAAAATGRPPRGGEDVAVCCRGKPAALRRIRRPGPLQAQLTAAAASPRIECRRLSRRLAATAVGGLGGAAIAAPR